jgi:hypothetical protein
MRWRRGRWEWGIWGFEDFGGGERGREGWRGIGGIGGMAGVFGGRGNVYSTRQRDIKCILQGLLRGL